MVVQILSILVLLLGCVCSAPAKEDPAAEQEAGSQKLQQDKRDLHTAASSYTRRYSDWGNYPGSGYSGYGVSSGYGVIDDRYSSFSSGYNSGYDNYGGYPGYSGYSGGYGGYNKGGYGLTGGYGGYGGYAGNGGLNSYTGYNNPYHQGSYHLGYGYYNSRPHGNIYNSGITPNLVTGYRGYSR